ncbi:MAG TPA: hypothetical protein VHS27_04765 [Gaiellales bacterium]|jgi:hypothetical protein|nr:hypothetical protein [Gaiellales bacterium]
MILLSLSSYLPAGDLARIVAATLFAALVAPSAVAVGIAGLDRRHGGAVALGNTLVAVAAATLTLLVAIGIYALVQR